MKYYFTSSEEPQNRMNSLTISLFADITTLNTLAFVSYLRIIVVRALHWHRKNLGSIPAGGAVVGDEFFSTVPAWSFDMGMISTRDRTKTRYPTEIILHRVKCNKILIT